MRAAAALLSLIPALVVLTPNGRIHAQPNTIDDPDAYAVYASVLAEPSFRDDAAASEIAIFEETRAHTDCLPRAAEREVGPEWAAVVKSYREQNARPRRLLPGFNLGMRYWLISQSELERQLAAHPGVGRTGDGLVYAQFPRGKLFFLSAVGFDATRMRALVTVQHTCGFDCWGGSHILRVRNGERWVQPAGDVSTCTWQT